MRHVLGMTSGLKTDGTYEAPPATKFLYNTPIYAKTVQILEKASGLSVDEYTRKWLTERIGMRDSKWTPRDWVDEAAAITDGSRESNTIGFSASARDAARFGLMILAGGRWKNEDVIGDARYLDEAFASSQSHNPSYGLLWWLNGKAKSARGGKIVDGQLIPVRARRSGGGAGRARAQDLRGAEPRSGGHAARRRAAEGEGFAVGRLQRGALAPVDGGRAREALDAPLSRSARQLDHHVLERAGPRERRLVRGAHRRALVAPDLRVPRRPCSPVATSGCRRARPPVDR